MTVFIAGASGVVGKRLSSLLISAGHRVVGMIRSAAGVPGLLAANIEPVAGDLLDRGAVLRAVTAARPEVIIHQATALKGMRSFRHFDEQFVLTNRLRTEGTRHLMAAAREAGTRLFVAQSYAGWPVGFRGNRVKTEQDPFDPDPPGEMRRTQDAIRKLEDQVLSAGDLTGIVLRYGSLYGPGTSIGEGGSVVEAVRRRQLPLFGDGAGVWSFTHVDDAAAATALAVEQSRAGVYNIVDDEPAEVSQWLPELARALGAKPPLHMPAWLGRLLMGDTGMAMMSRVRGASNAKAKSTFGWRPIYPSWRIGFREGLSNAARRVRSDTSQVA